MNTKFKIFAVLLLLVLSVYLVSLSKEKIANSDDTQIMMKEVYTILFIIVGVLLCLVIYYKIHIHIMKKRLIQKEFDDIRRIRKEISHKLKKTHEKQSIFHPIKAIFKSNNINDIKSSEDLDYYYQRRKKEMNKINNELDELKKDMNSIKQNKI